MNMGAAFMVVCIVLILAFMASEKKKTAAIVA